MNGMAPVCRSSLLTALITVWAAVNLKDCLNTRAASCNVLFRESTYLLERAKAELAVFNEAANWWPPDAKVEVSLAAEVPLFYNSKVKDE